jgi:glycosyl transferase family 87
MITRERLQVAWRVASVVALAYLAWRWWTLLPEQGGIHGVDARTYWGVPLDDPYQGPQVGLPGAYLYSPAFLQALAPFRALPWEVFHGLWTALAIAAAVFMVGPIGAAVAIGLLPFVFRDLFVGNIHLMLGAAMVIGMRHPAAWSAVLLTKVTPGVGVLWFGVRREWRRLAVASGVTLAIASISFLLGPALWFEWIERLTGDTGTAGGGYMVFLLARVAVAGALVVWGALTDRSWLVPIAATIAVPIIWPDSLAMLLAAIPLFRDRRSGGLDELRRGWSQDHDRR